MKKPNLAEVKRKLKWRSKRDWDDTSIMENLEDYYGVNLTKFYGEDYTKAKNMKRLMAKLKRYK